jgi:hypothetical protein
MSSARFMRHVIVAGKQVNIYVAQEIRQAGIRRSIDAIDPALLRDTVNKVAMALVGNKLLSEAQQGQTKHVTITFVRHRKLKTILLTKTDPCLTRVPQTKTTIAPLRFKMTTELPSPRDMSLLIRASNR